MRARIVAAMASAKAVICRRWTRSARHQRHSSDAPPPATRNSCPIAVDPIAGIEAVPIQLLPGERVVGDQLAGEGLQAAEISVRMLMNPSRTHCYGRPGHDRPEPARRRVTIGEEMRHEPQERPADLDRARCRRSRTGHGAGDVFQDATTRRHRSGPCWRRCRRRRSGTATRSGWPAAPAGSAAPAR